MFDQIIKEIKSAKKELRKKSKNYKENFNQIKEYINLEVEEIKKLKKLKKSIIPELSFDSIEKDNFELIKNIKRRGCVIIRDVFDDQKVENLNRDFYASGKHQLDWIPQSHISSGIYFVLLKTTNEIITHKILFLK